MYICSVLAQREISAVAMDVVLFWKKTKHVHVIDYSFPKFSDKTIWWSLPKHFICNKSKAKHWEDRVQSQRMVIRIQCLDRAFTLDASRPPHSPEHWSFLPIGWGLDAPTGIVILCPHVEYKRWYPSGSMVIPLQRDRFNSQSGTIIIRVTLIVVGCWSGFG